MKKIYIVDGVKYEIPDTETSAFLKDNPNAKAIYNVEGKEYHIPHQEADAFETDMGLKKKADTQVSPTSATNSGVTSSPTQSEGDSKIPSVDIRKGEPEDNSLDGNAPGNADDPFANMKYADELSKRSQVIAGRNVPDESAKAYSASIVKGLQEKGYDKDFLNSLVDLPDEALQHDPGTSKDAILNLYKANPIKASQLINEAKNHWLVRKSAEQSTDGNDYQKSQTGIMAANAYTGDVTPDNITDLTSTLKQKNKVLEQTLSGDDLVKAKDRLQQSYSSYINPTSKGFKEDYDQSKFKDKLDPNQYAGLKTLQIFKPEEYKQAVDFLNTNKPQQYELHEGLSFGKNGFSLNNTDEKETDESVNYRIGMEQLNKKLSDIGRYNLATDARNNIYNIKEQAKTIDNQDDLNTAQSDLDKNNNILNAVYADSQKDDERYPLSTQLSLDNNVKELTQKSGMNPLEYAIYHFGKGFEKSGNSVGNVLTSLFGSDNDNAERAVTASGENISDQSTGYLPSSLRSEQPQVIVKFPKEVQAQRDAIMKNENLTEDEKQQQLSDLIEKNKGSIETITNPNAGKHANFFSKATLYGNAGTIGDIASIAAQSAGLNAAGAGRLLSTALPMFTSTQDDFYKEAIAEGKTPEDASSYANTHAAIMAAAGLINPDINIVKRALGTETALGKTIAGIDEATWNDVVNSNKSLLKKITNSVESVTKETLKMGAVYGAGTSVAGDLADNLLFNKNNSTSDIIDHAVRATKDITLNSMAIFGLNALSHFKDVSPEQKSRIWEIGTNKDIGLQQIDDAVNSGQLSAGKAEQYKNIINETSKLISQVPTENAKGKPLTDKERVDYLYNLVSQSKANELAKTLPPKDAEKAEHEAMVSDFRNNEILNSQTDKQLDTRKSQLEKSLIPEKDANGKNVPIPEEEKKKSEAERQVVSDLIDERSAAVADKAAKEKLNPQQDISSSKTNDNGKTQEADQANEIGAAKTEEPTTASDNKGAVVSETREQKIAKDGLAAIEELRQLHKTGDIDNLPKDEERMVRLADRAKGRLDDYGESLVPSIDIWSEEGLSRAEKILKFSLPKEKIGDKGAVDMDEEDGTSIKNAVTKMQRETLGLKEADETMHKSFGTTWEEAKDKLDKGYHPQDLVDELKQKARPLTDVEDAIILHHQNTKEIELMNANKQINEAAESGDNGLLVEAKVRRSRILDELQDIYDVDKAAGRENARGLSARQMMIDRKYNLVNMMAEKRAANEGEALSPEQEKEVEALHAKIKETQNEFDKYKSQAENEIKNLQERVLGKPIGNKKSAADKLRAFADRIDKETKGKTYSTIIPITPKMISGAIRLIADGIEKGGKVIDLIKDVVDSIKKSNPGIDEGALTKEINKAAIESGINGSPIEAKKAKDLSGVMLNNKLDRTALKLSAEAQRAKDEFSISIKRDEAKKRTFGQKAQDTFVKWERGFKLTNPITIGKLMAAGLTRLATTPIEDIAGAGISAILPKSLSKGAIGEGGGLHLRETADAYKNGLLQGMKDSYSIMKKGDHGKSDLDVVFGKGVELPPEAIDFFGQLHSATKAPIKRFAFERALSKRLRRSAAAGMDISDPIVQTKILIDSYKDANRAIFMQDNGVARGWQRMVDYFDRVDTKTGKAPSKIAATTLKWLVPFVKVPTNIAAEIGTHVYGIPVGIGKIVYNSITKGLENVPQEEKDVILRNLKKGSIGAAALAIGYFNPQVFGGYYQSHEKMKDGDAKPGTAKIFGMDIPAWLIESPIFQVMQVGATARRVKDAKVKGEENGISEGIIAGGLGMLDKLPMVDQINRTLGALHDPKERQYYLGELAKSSIDPAALQKIAEWTDNDVKRDPKTIGEHVEMGIPGLRENVGKKPPPKTFTIKDITTDTEREATAEEVTKSNVLSAEILNDKLSELTPDSPIMIAFGHPTTSDKNATTYKKYSELSDADKKLYLADLKEQSTKAARYQLFHDATSAPEEENSEEK